MYKHLNTPLAKFLLGLVELFMGLTFVLKVLNASTSAPFVKGLYAVTNALASPFAGMFKNIDLRNGGVFDLSLLSGMIIYAALVTGGMLMSRKYKKDRDTQQAVQAEVVIHEEVIIRDSDGPFLRPK